MMVYFISAQTYIIYALIWPEDNAISFLELYASPVQPLVLVFLGQVLENQVTNKREALTEVVVTSMFATDEPNEILEVASYVTEWKWALYGGGVFQIDIACISVFLDFLTVYSTFMIQLELSEEGL